MSTRVISPDDTTTDKSAAMAAISLGEYSLHLPIDDEVTARITAVTLLQSIRSEFARQVPDIALYYDLYLQVEYRSAPIQDPLNQKGSTCGR